MTNNYSLRKPSLISNIPKSGSLFYFSDQQNDKIEITGSNISISSFVRLGMKEAVFKDCSFTKSSFEDLYFRKAKFNNIQFTGSKFSYCNFDKAIFQTCDFSYCSFFYCKLPLEEIKSCLPYEANLRRDLARNLRKNYEMLGDKKSADEFLDIEIKAFETELQDIFLSKTDYYKQHFNFREQLSSGIKYLLSKASGWIWGYGHRIFRLFFSFLMIILLCSLATWILKIQFIEFGEALPKSLTFWDSIYITLRETINLSNTSIVPVKFVGKLMLLLESFLGTIFLAFLAATIYRRIAR